MDTKQCTIDGCTRDAEYHDKYCGNCLNEMQHAALDLAGVE